METVDALVRIKFNVAEDPKDFPALRYTLDVLEKHSRSKDPTRSDSRKKGTSVHTYSTAHDASEEDTDDNLEEDFLEFIGRMDSNDEVVLECDFDPAVNE